jgi:tetratricopeptide (TPR) repeat protein
LLEFHGQRDLHAQTDQQNADDLEKFQRAIEDPVVVAAVRQESEPAYLARARVFEKAESYRSAYRNYESAYHLNAHSMEAVAGMDRNAHQTEERKAVALALGLPNESALQNRTEWALQKARGGQFAQAQFLFAENAAAYPNDASAHFNFGVFSMEQNDLRGALQLFEQTIALDPTNIPAHEAIAEVHLKLHEYPEAAKWSRRILELDPNHATARQILNTLEREARN